MCGIFAFLDINCYSGNGKLWDKVKHYFNKGS